MASMNDEVANLAEEYGFTVERTSGGKIALLKDGCRPVYTNSNLGEWRALRNLRSTLRRASEEAR